MDDKSGSGGESEVSCEGGENEEGDGNGTDGIGVPNDEGGGYCGVDRGGSGSFCLTYKIK